MSQNKNVYILVLALVIIGGLIFYNSQNNTSGETTYVTSKVDRGDLVSIVKSNGTINPSIQIDVRPEISGTIRDINVDINAKVSKEDIIAKIDPASYKSSLNQARAKFNKSSIELKLNRNIYETNKVLFNKNLISKEEFDSSKANYNSTFAIYEEAKTILEQSKLDLEKTNIRSKIDGVVLSRNVEIGQYINNNGGTPIFIIANDLANMDLTIKVSESDIGKIKKGQLVEFGVSAFPEKTFNGEIYLVSNSPNFDKNLVTYDVKATIENMELILKPGMTAETNIIIADKKNILRVPTAALRFVPSNIDSISKDGYFVWSNSNNKLEQIKINVGISNQDYTELLDSSLDEGTEIIVDSYINNKSSKSLFTLPQPKRY